MKKLIVVSMLGFMLMSSKAYAMIPDNCNPYSNVNPPYTYCQGQWVKICTTASDGYSRQSEWICVR